MHGHQLAAPRQSCSARSCNYCWPRSELRRDPKAQGPPWAVGQSARSSRACTHQQWCFAPASAWELSLLFWWFPWNTKPQGFFQLSVRRTGAQRKELLTSIQHEQQKHNSFPGSVGRDTHLGAAPSSEGFFFRFVSDSVSPSLLP